MAYVVERIEIVGGAISSQRVEHGVFKLEAEAIYEAGRLAQIEGTGARFNSTGKFHEVYSRGSAVRFIARPK